MLGLLLASLAVAGCEADSQDSKKSASGLSAEEVAARYGWVDRDDDLTPVYVLVPQFNALSVWYAQDLLARRCLAGVFEYPAVPPDQQQSPTEDKRTGLPLFDEQIAAQYGYHMAPPPAAPNTAPITDSVHDKMVACGKDSAVRLGHPPESPLDGIVAAGWAAIEGDAGIRKAEQAWRTCMEPVGLIDLPASPSEMPPASVIPPPVYNADGFAIDPPTTAVTQAERDVAVADARCRVESGYTDAFRQARARGELEAIGADIEGFEAARTAYLEYQKGIDAVIAELG